MCKDDNARRDAVAAGHRRCLALAGLEDADATLGLISNHQFSSGTGRFSAGGIEIRQRFQLGFAQFTKIALDAGFKSGADRQQSSVSLRGESPRGRSPRREGT